ncbi:manganese/zinc/iron transport system ATP-binding protein [Oceanicella actignis]|uniref:Manganese/zinc/iron transport system ATP-binding protein n=2 Tax=Oceanicella actignis TaxID=1189325 RepID=A0A1M7TXN2_9RHOB|nr:manganese/zinc/iron transport system ATP-binding protein [Oceanicella actignis]SHN75489.1 manganese/zinc/iron transport system ATP-binding protein [Oceanicella actignis]
MSAACEAAAAAGPARLARDAAAGAAEKAGTATMARAPAQGMSVRGLSVSYGRTPAIMDVDADFPLGAMTAIIGPNGAGKSTLLKAALGLVPRLTGEVRVLGRPLERARDLIAYVPQRASVDWEFPARVIDVALMGLYRRKGLWRLFDRNDRRRAMECLAMVGMESFARRQIGELSGGQQQRVFIARALAQDAQAYLLDEPFAGVDAATERAIVAVLRQLRDAGRAVVCVHHDLSTAPVYFDRALLLNRVVVAQGPTAETLTPRNLRLAYGGRLETAATP